MRKPTLGISILLVITLVIIAGILGWYFGRSGGSNNNKQSSSQPSSQPTTGVQSLISYSLPNGWRQSTCSSANNTFYVLPPGTSLNCSTAQSAPIYITTDPQNTTDCNQLKASGVLKHTCISLYIDGHKSLKSFTQTKQSSSLDYYVNTGNGVVKLDYTYASANNYQAGFQAIINSLKVKT